MFDRIGLLDYSLVILSIGSSLIKAELGLFELYWKSLCLFAGLLGLSIMLQGDGEPDSS